MSATLPRSKSGSRQPKLEATSKEKACKKQTQMVGNPDLKHQFSGKSKQELVQGDHPWSGVAEAILKPLPADWRHNIQNAFSQLGDALGKLLGAGEGQKISRGRRGF
ncbi:hypothetical protein COHA_010106 [Chlorella ohadii]|uniref:Uncharacterized protein n=1 Tax=Chlorella ohadii TaxID=2649997 RepID=A0AAD5DED2_9CHLO|nr:hypothetical protein COHA_010106 [Chlorella ohadii]